VVISTRMPFRAGRQEHVRIALSNPAPIAINWFVLTPATTTGAAVFE